MRRSRSIVAIASLLGLGVAPSLSAQNSAPPASARVTVADYLEWEDVADPQLSPDGKKIAHTGYDSTDATWKDANIYLMNADGSNPHVINAALDRNPLGMMRAPDASGLHYNVENEGCCNLCFTSMAGQTRAITSGKNVLTVTDVDRAGNMVGVMLTVSRPNDIVRFSVRTPAAMLRFNDEWHGTSSKPSNWMRTQLYMRSWFDRWPSPVTTSSRDRAVGR